MEMVRELDLFVRAKLTSLRVLGTGGKSIYGDKFADEK